MEKSRIFIIFFVLAFFVETLHCQNVDLSPETITYAPFIWPSEIPDDCPFRQSEEFNTIKFLGFKSGYRYGDTWYPTWASNDTLYSPWTDGNSTKRLDGGFDLSHSGAGPYRNQSATGVIVGSDPMNLKAYGTGVFIARSNPYMGRYPCGSLVYNGIWYYGTYCLGPSGSTKYGNITVNWPWLGPFVGFRYSTDYGRTWTASPHKPDNPIFGETGINGYPIKIGAPHFVDFGKNMEHSPDGKAYLVAHGADTSDSKWRFWNHSWINGDQIYLLRVTPSIENINDITKYEFYGGKDEKGNPVWTSDFNAIKPLLEWNNNMGCVTITYNAPLKKYLMCITDGGNTASKMNTYILESDKLEGEWKIMAYMKDFGEQAYFVNIPSKFISDDGKQMWMLYSGNFAKDWNGQKIEENPPGSHYGMVFQKIELLKEPKDINSVPFDLKIPEIKEGSPAAGKRVRQKLANYEDTGVYHILYLPENWEKGKQYPVIIEYPGNGPYRGKYGDVCSGKPDDAHLGYGFGGGKDFIWVVVPFISSDGQRNQLKWWGDVKASVNYTTDVVKKVCREFGGDSSLVFLTGFSRGAIGCNYIGLNNDEIAELWCASVPFSHYDGVITNWGYDDCDKESAKKRLTRLKGRPQLIIHENMGTKSTQEFIESTGIKGNFTYLNIPYRNHNDKWIFQDIPERKFLREWIADVIETGNK